MVAGAEVLPTSSTSCSSKRKTRNKEKIVAGLLHVWSVRDSFQRLDVTPKDLNHSLFSASPAVFPALLSAQVLATSSQHSPLLLQPEPRFSTLVMKL